MMHGVLAGGKREPDSREVISHEIRKKRKALKLDSIVWKLDVFPTRDEFDHSLEGRNPIGSILLMSSNTVLQLVETFNSAFLDSSISKYEWGLRVRNVTYRDLREQLNCKSSSSSNGDEEGEYSCIQLGEMCIGARPCWISGPRNDLMLRDLDMGPETRMIYHTNFESKQTSKCFLFRLEAEYQSIWKSKFPVCFNESVMALVLSYFVPEVYLDNIAEAKRDNKTFKDEKCFLICQVCLSQADCKLSD
ncbi:hypothetical protein AAMO2058_001305500, partial [Amorphochlora amoebiformis]